MFAILTRLETAVSLQSVSILSTIPIYRTPLSQVLNPYDGYTSAYCLKISSAPHILIRSSTMSSESLIP